MIGSELERIRGVHVWVFPTGYGKTTALLHAGLKDVRVIHVLPLQAVVYQLVNRLQAAGFDVCYQMALSIPGACKSPYLAAKYNVVTVDSYLFNVLGVPVFELFRDAWHSDVAWLLANHADFVVLDEYHLMTAPDGDGDVSKIHSSVVGVVELLRRKKWVKRVLVLTATITPSMVAQLDPDGVLIYAPRGHRYVEAVAKELGNSNRVKTWEPKDGFADAMKDKLRGVEFVDVESERACGYVETPVEEFYGYVSFNSWRRAHLYWRKLSRGAVLLHGKIDLEARRELVGTVKEALVSTQVVEAGVDVSFGVLYTEEAPAFSLIQRTGRVARRRGDQPGRVYVLKAKYDASAGVYDRELTNATMKKLEEVEGEINWKVPESGGYDYLDLLVDVDGEVKRKLGGEGRYVKSLMEVLDRYVLNVEMVLEELDKLGGSFVRSSSLFRVVEGNKEFVVDVSFLKKVATRVFLCGPERCVEHGVGDLERRPLSTLYKAAREVGGWVEYVKLDASFTRERCGGVEFSSFDPCHVVRQG